MFAFVPTFVPTGVFYAGPTYEQTLEEQSRVQESSRKWAAWVWGDEGEESFVQPLSASLLREKDGAQALETASTAASTESDTATTCSDVTRTPMKLKELPCLAEDYEVEKTFVTVRPVSGSRKRESSCPARIHTPTTVMLRNLPNRAKLVRFQEHLINLGGADLYESVYMPVDTRTGMNKGYAFVHFKSQALAAKFTAKVAGTKLPGSQSSKVLALSEAKQPGLASKPRRIGSYSARVWVK
jgi:hypothetical protein